MTKNFKYWVVATILAIWQFPQLLVSVIMLPFLGKKEKIADRHHNVCFKAKNMMGGISLGPLCFVSEHLAKRPEYVAHEVDGHTVDSKRFGPLYLFIIGIPSILHAGFGKGCYFDFYTERRANKYAKLYADMDCCLHFNKQ